MSHASPEDSRYPVHSGTSIGYDIKVDFSRADRLQSTAFAALARVILASLYPNGTDIPAYLFDLLEAYLEASETKLEYRTLSCPPENLELVLLFVSRELSPPELDRLGLPQIIIRDEAGITDNEPINGVGIILPQKDGVLYIPDREGSIFLTPQSIDELFFANSNPLWRTFCDALSVTEIQTVLKNAPSPSPGTAFEENPPYSLTNPPKDPSPDPVLSGARTAIGPGTQTSGRKTPDTIPSWSDEDVGVYVTDTEVVSTSSHFTALMRLADLSARAKKAKDHALRHRKHLEDLLTQRNDLHRAYEQSERQRHTAAGHEHTPQSFEARLTTAKARLSRKHAARMRDLSAIDEAISKTEKLLIAQRLRRERLIAAAASIESAQTALDQGEVLPPAKTKKSRRELSRQQQQRRRIKHLGYLDTAIILARQRADAAEAESSKWPELLKHERKKTHAASGKDLSFDDARDIYWYSAYRLEALAREAESAQVLRSQIEQKLAEADSDLSAKKRAILQNSFDLVSRKTSIIADFSEKLRDEFISHHERYGTPPPLAARTVQRAKRQAEQWICRSIDAALDPEPRPSSYEGAVVIDETRRTYWTLSYRHSAFLNAGQEVTQEIGKMRTHIHTLTVDLHALSSTDQDKKDERLMLSQRLAKGNERIRTLSLKSEVITGLIKKAALEFSAHKERFSGADKFGEKLDAALASEARISATREIELSWRAAKSDANYKKRTNSRIFLREARLRRKEELAEAQRAGQERAEAKRDRATRAQSSPVKKEISTAAPSEIIAANQRRRRNRDIVKAREAFIRGHLKPKGSA